ncbi:hypothetical protein [Methylophilus sp. 5]|uniref:hypothetical protein n=1 Tax=Methylophilus sp. 5 TaxID=1112274 RepID=UPI00350F182C
MLYVGYPKLNQEERLATLRAVDLSKIKFSAEKAWAIAGSHNEPEIVRLNMHNDRPTYHFLQGDSWLSIWADTGQRLAVDNDLIRGSIREFSPHVGIQSSHLITRDQWSISSGLNAHRPLHKIVLKDDKGTELYVSSHTGEVVLDTQLNERTWNWLGSVIHWIYFTPLRVERELWRQVIMWTSGAAFVLTALGMWLGIQRIRIKRRYSNNRVSPYRGWARWHHFSGLIAGIFCITWLFSGWLSVKPFDWISSRKMSEQETLAWTGGKISLGEMKLPSQLAMKEIKEIEWAKFDGKVRLLAYTADSKYLLDISNGAAVATFDQTVLAHRAQAMQPGVTQISAEWLNDGDMYYRSNPEHKISKVLKVEFADNERTTYYLAPETGQVVSSHNNDSRLYRWLFNALHCMDFPPLRNDEVSRQAIIIALSLGGILVSVAGVVLGWRRLRH